MRDRECNTTHGHIINVKGAPLERIVLYLCITSVFITWIVAGS